MRILGIGNALLDIVSMVEDEFPASVGIHPSSVAHVEAEVLEPILINLPEPTFVSGGGAANTMKVASHLGLETAFCGSVGNDRFGDIFREGLSSAGVRTQLKLAQEKTGFSVILRTRSGLSSLAVSPGASLALEGRDIPDSLIDWADWVYAEGFLLGREGLLLSALNRALLAGKKIAFDLGSWRMVRQSRDLALEICARYADIVFCNEEEFEALADMSMKEAVEFFRPESCHFVIKRGAAGAVWLCGERSFACPADNQEMVEPTAAGDAFAAGYLCALSRGEEPLPCLALGNEVAARVIAVPGSHVESDDFAGIVYPFNKKKK